MKIIKNFLLLLMVNSSVSCGSKSNNNNDLRPVYVGTYTKAEGHVNGQAQGIYLLHQHAENGSLKVAGTVAEITNPSFVRVSGDGKNLYAVSELGPGDAASGFIYSYKINDDDSLEEIGKLSTGSYAPCHIEIDMSGKYVFVANYMGGVVMMYERQQDGALIKKQQINLENPDLSHAHSVSITSDNKQAYIADLGNDKIWIFDFDPEKGQLIPNDQAFISLEKGAGPRHFSFSKEEDFAYSINELNSTLSAFKIKENGGLEAFQNITTLPEDFSGDNSGADIHLHPSGKYIYASNRGHNSIAGFRIDDSTGELIKNGHISTSGETPRNFAISPDGEYLYAANQDSDNITVFSINSETGQLSSHSEKEIKTPVCIEFSR